MALSGIGNTVAMLGITVMSLLVTHHVLFLEVVIHKDQYCSLLLTASVGWRYVR
jgi:hypothetical protein